MRASATEDVSPSTNSAPDATDAPVAVLVTPGYSLTFSAPFVRAMREMKAGGESSELVVTLIQSTFNRRWINLIQESNGGGRSFDEDRDREMRDRREEVFHESVAAIVGEDSFTAYDRQRMLRIRLGRTAYSLTEAESNELYRVEKEHDQRNAELKRAINAGEIDPYDAAGKQQQFDEAYRQERDKLLSDKPVSVPPIIMPGNFSTMIQRATQGLNLTAQQLSELADLAQKRTLAEGEMQRGDTNAIARVRELEDSAERDWERILGPEKYADYKRMNDYRYQQMKQYQQHWQLSDGQVNELYLTYLRHDKAVEQFTSQASQASQGTDAKPDEETTARIEAFAKDDRKGLQAELLQLLGEDRYKRFQAAGLVPQGDE